MYAREVLQQLNDDPFLDLESLPFGLAELYMTRYVKTFPSDDALDQFEEHSGPMLALLVASRGPLPVEVVRGAGVDARVKQKRSFKEQRRRHLEFVKTMCVGSLVEIGELQFSHKSFADWLLDKKKKNKKFRIKLKRAQRLMADVCWEELQGGDGGGDSGGDGGSSSSDEEDSSDDDQDGGKEKEKGNRGAESSSKFHKYALTHGVALNFIRLDSI